MLKLYNICLARGGCGLERMFLNYDEILENHINILSSNSWVLKNIKSNNYIIVNKCNVLYKLFKLINNSDKNLFICHCKRSLYYLDILKWYFGSQIITILVNHNHTKIKKSLSADYSIIISKKMNKIFIENKYNEKKIFTLNNFSIREKREIFLKKSIKNIAFIGRLSLEKGCFKMITQLKKILINKNLKLNIYGDGIEFNKILDYIKKNNLSKYIELHGWIDDISKCYENNDIIIVSSVYESFGVVIIDAFYYNCPCIISDNVLINNEIIFNEDNCLTYDINNDNELEEKIIKLINNNDLFNKIQINGFDTFNKKLSHDIAKNKLNDVINNILNEEGIHNSIKTNKKLKILYINDGIHFNIGYNFIKLFDDHNIELFDVKIKMLIPCLSRIILNLIIRFPILYFLIIFFYKIKYPSNFGVPNLIYSHGGKTSFLNIYFSYLYNCDNFYTSSLRNLSNKLFTKIFTLQNLDYYNHFRLRTGPSNLDFKITKENNLWLFCFGGNGSGYKFKENDIIFYCDLMNNFSKKYNIKWLISTSRRTSKKHENIIKNKLNKKIIKDMILFNSNDKRSIKKFYSTCEAIFVSIESTTMISESINLIKPVILLESSIPTKNEMYLKNIKNFINNFNLRIAGKYSLEEIYNYVKNFKEYEDPQKELKIFLKKYIE